MGKYYISGYKYESGKPLPSEEDGFNIYGVRVTFDDALQLISDDIEDIKDFYDGDDVEITLSDEENSEFNTIIFLEPYEQVYAKKLSVDGQEYHFFIVMYTL